MIREIPHRIPKSMSFQYILLAHSDSCNIVVFSRLLDDHTIMANFSFAQHRIGYRNQRLNSQFSAFSAAQSHSTSGTRHVLLRLRRFSPLSYVNDYRANDYRAKVVLRCASDNQRSIYHAPINNQDSLAIINICAKTWYSEHTYRSKSLHIVQPMVNNPPLKFLGD